MTPEAKRRIAESKFFLALVTVNYLRKLGEKLPECLYAKKIGKLICFVIDTDVADRAELEALRMACPPDKEIWCTNHTEPHLRQVIEALRLWMENPCPD